MNVSTAFNSLFNAEYSQEYVGTSTLLEITQVSMCSSFAVIALVIL